MKDAYCKFPPWQFYTSSGTDVHPERVRRVYGVIECADGTCRLHAATAMFMWVNDNVGGIACGEVQSVDDWAAHQRVAIEQCGAPELFFDPCGWLSLANNASESSGGEEEEEGEGYLD